MKLGRARAAALWVVLIPTPLGAHAVPAEPAARCEFSAPALPAPPADSALDRYAEPHSVYEWDGGYERAHLGIGHLAVVEGTHYPWYAGVVVPLYDTPIGPLVAWINRGFTEGPAGEHRDPFTGAGVVETSYDAKTPIVYDRTPSGCGFSRGRRCSRATPTVGRSSVPVCRTCYGKGPERTIRESD